VLPDAIPYVAASLLELLSPLTHKIAVGASLRGIGSAPDRRTELEAMVTYAADLIEWLTSSILNLVGFLVLLTEALTLVLRFALAGFVILVIVGAMYFLRCNYVENRHLTKGYSLISYFDIVLNVALAYLVWVH
jgi:hypothetical protein